MRSVHFFAQRPGPSLSSSLNEGPVLVMRSPSRSAANDPSQPAASRVCIPATSAKVWVRDRNLHGRDNL
jgi:hypothetical protein